MSEIDELVEAFGVPTEEIQFETRTIRRRNRFKKRRRLKGTWTVQLEDDLKNNHGIDIEAEMADMLAQELKEQFDMEFLRSFIPKPKSRFKKDPLGRK